MSLHVRLAPGVALHSTERGLIARTPSRWVRVDLRDRALESTIVARLASDATIEPSADEPIARAIEPLRKTGVLADAGTPRADAGPVLVTLASGAARDSALLIGAPDDRALGEALEHRVRLGLPTLVAWIDERGVALARDDGTFRGCPVCAWSMDSALARYVAPGLDLASVPRAFADSDVFARIASAATEEALRDPGAPPRAGEIVTFDRERAEATAILAHPSCLCADRPRREPSVPPPPATWDSLASLRHAPVWPVERATSARAARVVYRRSRAPWTADAAALGVALGSGDEAETRALAEAIERFCLLHAPPDTRGRGARELEGDVLSAAEIASLTFRSEEYAARGFRFRPFSAEERLDWSVARSLDGVRTVFVPTSLVGRVPRGSRALVDATSNGYACHVDRALAIERGLLELLERDAILLHWYAPLEPLPRIDADLGLPGAVALLATQDVDVPVVLAAACRADGSLRCGAAAAVTIDGALRRAVDELRVALEGSAPSHAPVPLDDTARRYEPGDHLAHCAGESGRRLFASLTCSPQGVTLEELEHRWPRETAPARLARALGDRFDAWVVDRSLPDVFGREWHVVRVIVPGLAELSWGLPYRRLASPRIAERLARGAPLRADPHPIA